MRGLKMIKFLHLFHKEVEFGNDDITGARL